MQPRNEKFLTLFGKAVSNIVESAAIVMESVAASYERWAEPAKTCTPPSTPATTALLAHAVTGSVRRALAVGDLSFGSYQVSPGHACLTAARFMKEAQVAVIKLDGGLEMVPQTERSASPSAPVSGSPRSTSTCSVRPVEQWGGGESGQTTGSDLALGRGSVPSAGWGYGGTPWGGPGVDQGSLEHA